MRPGASISIQISAEGNAKVSRLCSVSGLRRQYAGTIMSFLEPYLITDEGPGSVPFGGRDQEFAILEQWLADEKSLRV